MRFIPYFYDAPLKITCNYSCHVTKSIIISIIIYNITLCKQHMHNCRASVYINSVKRIGSGKQPLIRIRSGKQPLCARRGTPALLPHISCIRKPLAPFLCSFPGNSHFFPPIFSMLNESCA